MSGLHLWFRSGQYSLLGHLDAPRSTKSRVGVVIVPPFGWEDVISYRPLRFMAKEFARLGMPTLRYDLPGTGDSSGGACDADLFEAWIQSVGDAAAELRRCTDVENVAVLGVHMGAMLAVAAASRGADIQQLALWGPAAKGRTILRELKAAASIESWEYLPAEEAPPQPLPGFEAGGFLMAPETQRALESLDISILTWPDSIRVMMLTRDDLPHDARLTEAWKVSRPQIEMSHGRGYHAMMATPHDAVFSEATTQAIATFLSRGISERVARNPMRISDNDGERVMAKYDAMLESVHCVETSSLNMFGILAEPMPGAERSDYCILYLNPGGVRHTGPNRMWVESARRWAANGIASLRLDLQSIGESDGDHFVDVPGLYRSHLVEQIEVAIDSLRRQTGVKRFVAIGLCSGACWAFHAAVRNSDVRAAILVNPSLLSWDPGADRRRMLRPLATSLTGWAEWSRMVRGAVRRGDIHGAARRITERLSRKRTSGSSHLELGFERLEQAWASFERTKKRVTLVFRHGEPLLEEMEAAGQLPPENYSYVRCERLPNAGHTLRPLWAQKMVHDLIDAEIGYVVRGVPSGVTARQSDEGGLSTQTVHA